MTTPQTPPNSSSFIERNALLIKAGLIVVLVLLLLIPTSMIKSLIHERESRQWEAVNEVSNKWAQSQTVSGPILSIPYDKYEKRYIEDEGVYKTFKKTQFIHILPEKLDVEGIVNPVKKRRGIYEIVVYSSDIKSKGYFAPIDLSKHNLDDTKIHLDRAFVSVGIDDLRGIKDKAQINWNDETLTFNPGLPSNDILKFGITTPVNIMQDSLVSPEQIEFDFDLKIHGSEQLRFIPIGKETDVKLSSSWNDPKYDGAFLPLPMDSNLTEGFEAIWKVLHLNRNYPQQWIGTEFNVIDSSFGVDLMVPVGAYQKTLRSVKYSIMLISLTFLVFFFIEMLNKKYVHPVQYILVGLALCIFYALLLSFSEHTSFNLSYLLAGGMTIALVSIYSTTMFKSIALTSMLGGILTVLYGFIFVITQEQDYALLFGSIGLFLILGLVMFFSRKIDWTQLKTN